MRAHDFSKSAIKNLKQKINVRLDTENPELHLVDRTIYMRDVLVGQVCLLSLSDIYETDSLMIDKILNEGLNNNSSLFKALMSNDEEELLELGIHNKQLAFYGFSIEPELKCMNMQSLYSYKILHYSLKTKVEDLIKLLATKELIDSALKYNNTIVSNKEKKILFPIITDNRHVALKSLLIALTILWILQERNKVLTLEKGKTTADLTLSDIIGYIAHPSIEKDIMEFMENKFSLSEYNNIFIKELCEGSKELEEMFGLIDEEQSSTIFNSLFLRDYYLYLEACKNASRSEIDTDDLTNEKLYALVNKKYTNEEFGKVCRAQLVMLLGETYKLRLSGYNFNDLVQVILKLRAQLASKNDEMERLQKSTEDLTAKIKTIKSSGKALLTENKNKEKKIAALETRYNTLYNKYKSLEKSKGDIERFNSEIAGLNNSIESLKEDINTKSRIIGKMTSNMDRLSDENNYLNTKINELQRVLNEVKLSNNTSTVDNVKLSAIVSAIKHCRITIFGGNMMYSYLNELGLENLRLVGAEEKGVNPQDVAYQDIIVVITGYISHPLSLAAKSAAKAYDIKLVNFNGKNIDTLCRRIFNEIYG